MDYGPLEISYKDTVGFYVKATDNIQEYCLICEYSGNIKKGPFESSNDSIMAIDEEYSIIPETVANLAKYILGINNNKKSYQNVASMKVVIGESVHVVLYSFKKIMKGEALYYDYNEGNDGGEELYPTSNFITMTGEKENVDENEVKKQSIHNSNSKDLLNSNVEKKTALNA
jgi:hypothetical protein